MTNIKALQCGLNKNHRVQKEKNMANRNQYGCVCSTTGPECVVLFWHYRVDVFAYIETLQYMALWFQDYCDHPEHPKIFKHKIGIAIVTKIVTSCRVRKIKFSTLPTVS